MKASLASSLFLLSVTSVIATSNNAAAKPADLPQCQTLVQQCEKAGYEPGEHKKDGKGLWVDCVGAIAHGKSVPGVTASQADAKTCADAAKAEFKAHREAKKQ